MAQSFGMLPGFGPRSLGGKRKANGRLEADRNYMKKDYPRQKESKETFWSS